MLLSSLCTGYVQALLLQNPSALLYIVCCKKPPCRVGGLCTELQPTTPQSTRGTGLCIWLQVAAAARERADMAEQRLAQRAELSQERQQHIADLTQVTLAPSTFWHIHLCTLCSFTSHSFDVCVLTLCQHRGHPM